MTQLTIAIDPGLTGAVAHITPIAYAVVDMPTVRQYVSAPDLYRLLSTWCTDVSPLEVMVWVEQAQSMPGQGVTSSFIYGTGYGIVLGVVACLGVSYTLVRPHVWKKALGVTKDKEACRLRAQQLFPLADLRRKKDHGRAEALLIAHYGRMHHTHDTLEANIPNS